MSTYCCKLEGIMWITEGSLCLFGIFKAGESSDNKQTLQVSNYKTKCLYFTNRHHTQKATSENLFPPKTCDDVWCVADLMEAEVTFTMHAANTSGYSRANNAYINITQATGCLSTLVNSVEKVDICHKYWTSSGIIKMTDSTPLVAVRPPRSYELFQCMNTLKKNQSLQMWYNLKTRH